LKTQFGNVTYDSSHEKEVREELVSHFRQCPIPDDEILSNLGLFINSKNLSRILFMNHLYQQIIDIPGIIVEFGVRWGQNVAAFAALRGIYDTFNRHRKIVGFDTFTGFPSISDKDGRTSLAKIGGLAVSDNYVDYLGKLLELHEQDNPLSHIKKNELIAGDATVEIDDYLKNHHNKELYQKTGYLEEIDKFDYSYFRLSPKEASLMDPNQRIFLEAAYAVINDAGQGKRIANTRTGLYVGFFPIGKKYQQLISEARSARLPESLSGNIEPMISGRISYLLDLKGPSMLVNTACSSSLVALHLACKSIQRGECDQAIAGGIKLNILPLKGSLDIGIESKDGYTRSFDDRSDGTNWSEGVAAVFLKPLSKALEDKDNIYAVQFHPEKSQSAGLKFLAGFIKA